jgi:GT2 family glycosyltransferase
MNHPTVSVIVVNYQRADNLSRCLWGLSQQAVSHELIVTDDGSTDNSVAIARAAGATVITHPHGAMGIGPARWRGARVASGDLLVFLDSDVVIAPWALKTYADAYRDNPDRALGGYVKWLPGMVYPDTVTWDGLWNAEYPPATVYQAGMKLGMDPREAVGQMVLFEDARKVWTAPLSLISTNIAVPRHIYDAAGGWKRTLNGRGEDGEFSIRIAKAGFGFSYLIDAPAVHQAHEVSSGIESPMRMIQREHPDCFVDGKWCWPPRKME